MARVFLIDGDSRYRRLLRAALEGAQHEVVEFERGTQALLSFSATRPDIVLLDFDLPDMPGPSLCREVKSHPRTAHIPLIIVTIRGFGEDRLRGFKAGADDYVVKPFSLRELLLRIRALTAQRQHSGMSTVGEIKIDWNAPRVLVGGMPTELTPIELALLRAFCERPARMLSRDELLDAVWGIDSESDPRVVDHVVRRLRRKLGTAADHIQTVRGEGYRLNAPPNQSGPRP
jgi:two-component system phosphate regulon response regulator PhoB